MKYQSEYISNYCTIKDYRTYKKLTLIKCIRNPNFPRPRVTIVPKATKNLSKLNNNISRAKNKVYEYAMCNEFVWFITLTIDGTKFPRDDIKGFMKTFAKWLNNYNNRKVEKKIEYVLIPELHSDCVNWHLHGLLTELPVWDIKSFKSIKGSPKKLECYYNWLSYCDKFGFCSLGKIRDKEACSKYITKYITKNFTKQLGIKELNKHMYYNSKGLKTADIIKRGILQIPLEPDFENDHVMIKSFKNGSISLLNYINNIT